MSIPSVKFTLDDLCAANDDWQCSCGPAALAAILGMTLDEVRPHVETAGFSGWMNPTMMRAAIKHAGARITRQHQGVFPSHGLARIQWDGPWTHPGANPRWAYRFTHWVASWREGEHTTIFDCNAGLVTRSVWEAQIVPTLLANIPRSTGWFIATSWEIEKGASQ